MWHGSSLRLRQRLAHLCLLPGLFEAFVDFVPVDDVPPCGEIFRTAVLVFQVIGVLPDIVAEDGVVSLRERGILVGGGDDLQLAAVQNEPAPSGAELLCRGFVELLLKGLEIAEVLLDLLADFAGGFTSALRLHNLPEHGVVDVAAAVVADRGADIFWNIIQVAKQVFGRMLRQVRVLFDGSIQVGDIGLMMLVMVELHGRFINVWFEGGVVIW